MFSRKLHQRRARRFPEQTHPQPVLIAGEPRGLLRTTTAEIQEDIRPGLPSVLLSFLDCYWVGCLGFIPLTPQKVKLFAGGVNSNQGFSFALGRGHL